MRGIHQQSQGDPDEITSYAEVVRSLTFYVIFSSRQIVRVSPLLNQQLYREKKGASDRICRAKCLRQDEPDNGRNRPASWKATQTAPPKIRTALSLSKSGQVDNCITEPINAGEHLSIKTKYTDWSGSVNNY